MPQPASFSIFHPREPHPTVSSAYPLRLPPCQKNGPCSIADKFLSLASISDILFWFSINLISVCCLWSHRRTAIRKWQAGWQAFFLLPSVCTVWIWLSGKLMPEYVSIYCSASRSLLQRQTKTKKNNSSEITDDDGGQMSVREDTLFWSHGTRTRPLSARDGSQSRSVYGPMGGIVRKCTENLIVCAKNATRYDNWLA